MKNKVIVFAENRAIGLEIEKLLILRGQFDFSFEFCCSLEECVESASLARDNKEIAIVICKNEHIDAIVEKIKKDTDNLNLIFEQAVKLVDETSFKKMLFLPLELDANKFLDQFLEKKEVHVASVFGKNVSFVESKFKEFNCSYKIITKSLFLHTVYYSRAIDEGLLKSALGENYYSNKDESLAATCGRILKEKGLTVSFAEEISGGNVAARFIMESEVKLKNCHILLVDSEFAKFGLNQDTIAEKGIVSKEIVYELSKRLLNKSNSDLAVSVVGFNCDAGRTFVSVGNKDEIHVFSSVFYGDKTQIAENVCDFALFRLFRFLEENC